MNRLEKKEALKQQIAALVDEAFKLGFQHGVASVDEIGAPFDLKAAQEKSNFGWAATQAHQSANKNSTNGGDKEDRKRAPRGLLRRVLAEILREHPGSYVSDLERMVVERDSRISPKSVGNELRRYEGDVYKRDEPGGSRWYLLEGDLDELVGPSPKEEGPSN